MLECLDCGITLDYAYAYSRLRQTAFLDDVGLVISYSPVEDVYGIADYRCPNCGANVSDLIKEKEELNYVKRKESPKNNERSF